MKQEDAFSGIEAAVVMIAFVVVAAVFAYVMMGTGFFATQKLQEVTYAGIKQGTSTIITDGFMNGQYNEGAGGLQSISFSISIPEAGFATDLSEMVYYYSKDNDIGDAIPMGSVSPSSGILSPGNSTRIRLNLATAGRTGPMSGGTFSLEIKPPVGASTIIRRTLPAVFNGGYIP